MSRGRTHSYGLLGREDPFFATAAPHKTHFLESLHRAYGGPQSLPQRDEASFQRALQFRQAEKTHYHGLEAENLTLKEQLEATKKANAALKDETEKIRSLWEQLSKVNTNESGSPATETQSRGVRAGTDGSSAERDRHLVEPTNDSVSSRVCTHIHADEEVKGGTNTQNDVVRRKVLSTDVPDTRGQAGEHSAEGSEPRGGAESPGGEGDPADTVREDKE